MRVNISKYELEKHGLDVTDPNFSEIAETYIQDNYFNGADSAVIYLGYNAGIMQYEFDLIPG